MTDETNAYAVKINGVTFVSMDAAKSIVDEARKDGWNLATAIRALKENKE